MKYLPVLLETRGRRCLVIGCGKIGTRRIQRMAASGAVIDVISTEVSEQGRALASESGGSVEARAWREDDVVDGYQFVIAATDDKTLNAAITDLCRDRGIPCNCASDASKSSIAFPSIINRDPITISVSSGTASPILSRQLTSRIESMIPAGYGRLAELVARYRKTVKDRITDPVARDSFWKNVLSGAVAESIFSGDPGEAEGLLLEALENPETESVHGEVYLVGAGPGDPDLLTFRAYRLLQQAEVVLYDRLVSQRILDQVNPRAEMVYVGKQRANHSMDQRDINQTLVDYAVAGKRVARLKGGDPFIFGRGGEEIELLARNHVPFQVVPGITAASGCAAYSGIPLTHRDHAQSVRFVTGQLKDGTVDLPWEQLVARDQTVVIYMGLVGLPIIAEEMIRHGLAADTPAAIVEQGTTLDQRVHAATLSELPALAQQREVKAPTLLIIGSVVTLHEQLRWFEPDRRGGAETKV